MISPHQNLSRIIGIDPGYDRVGWAVGSVTHQHVTPLAYDIIQTNKQATIFHRYHQIQSELEHILTQWQPQVAHIESVFFASNQKTAMRVAEARGVIISCLLSHDMKVFECTPLQVKSAVTGFGRADKTAVAKMVRLQLKLPADPLIDDIMDALALLLVPILKPNVV